jgi:hypothetical protein
MRRAKVSVSSSPLRSGRLLAGGIAGLGLLFIWLSGPAQGQVSLEDYELNYSPAYAGSHGCQAVEECERVSSEALAKEDMLRRVPPKSTKGPRL